jgi:hypothetical protein
MNALLNSCRCEVDGLCSAGIIHSYEVAGDVADEVFIIIGIKRVALFEYHGVVTYFE